MDSALAWIGQIADWISTLIPRWKILPVTEGGVMYIRGSIVHQMQAGMNFYWPWWTLIDTYPIVRQTDNLPSQTLMTADDKVITVSGMVIYEVADVVRLLTQTHSAVRAITDICLAAIHAVCCEMTLANLQGEQRKGTLDTKLRNAAKRQLEDYGVRVLKVQLTDLAPARVYRLVQSNSKDGE